MTRPPDLVGAGGAQLWYCHGCGFPWPYEREACCFCPDEFLELRGERDAHQEELHMLAGLKALSGRAQLILTEQGTTFDVPDAWAGVVWAALAREQEDVIRRIAERQKPTYPLWSATNSGPGEPLNLDMIAKARRLIEEQDSNDQADGEGSA